MFGRKSLGMRYSGYAVRVVFVVLGKQPVAGDGCHLGGSTVYFKRTQIDHGGFGARNMTIDAKQQQLASVLGLGCDDIEIRSTDDLWQLSDSLRDVEGR